MKNRLWITGVILSFVVTLATCGGHHGSVVTTGVVTTLAGIAGDPGSLDATGTAATFHTPYGIATDGTSLFVADTGNSTIRKIDIISGLVSTLTGSAGVSGSTDGTGTGALFHAPCGITTDGTNLYVADTGNSTIRKVVISTGVVTTLAGSGATGSADGIGTLASFNLPFGITTDGTNLYVADTGNSTIRKVVISTGEVTTLAGTAGVPGSADGTGTAAMFHTPYGLVIYGTILYVADTGNSTIRTINIASGAVATFVGMAGVPGSIDGTGAAARFQSPCDVTTDGSILYITDTANSTIRKVLISSGTVATLAGYPGFFGSNDGTGIGARFYHPVGITSFASILYVTDTLNSTIRRVQ